MKEKKEISSFDLLRIAEELKSIAVRIGKIYQLDRETLKINLRLREAGKKALIFSKRRIYLSSYSYASPKTPTSFAMILRKHLENALIKNIYQHGFDRILIIEAEKKEKYRLIFELFGESNCILVNEQGSIIAALKYGEFKDRKIYPKHEYAFPESRINPFEIGKEELLKLAENEKISKVLALSLSLGRFYAEEICLRSNIDKSKKGISDDESERILKTISELKNLASKSKAFIFYQDSKPFDALPFYPEIYNQITAKEFASLNEALDNYFTSFIIQEIKEKVRSEVEKELELLKFRLREQARALRNLIKKEKELRDKAMLVYQKMNDIESSIARAREKGEKKFFLEINGRSMEIDASISAGKNASRLFIEAKKAREKAEKVREAILKTKDEIKKTLKKAEAKEVKLLEAQKIPEKIKEKRKEAWYEKFHNFKTSDGFLVIAGKDASMNELIFRKHLDKNDIFIHADIQGAPATVVKNIVDENGKIKSEAAIEEACCFAAAYSRAWRYGAFAIDVYWVYPEQVSKRAEHGEYLTKGAFVIRGKRNWKRVGIELCIGIKKEDSGIKLISAPETAIKKHAIVYLKLIPGRKKSREIADEIKKKLLSLADKEIREKIKKLDVEEIQKLIPSGGSEIAK